MRLRMIAYCLGVTATGLLADLPPVTSLLACFALAICAGMICRRFWPGSVVYSCLLLIACFTAGVTWHSLWAGRILDQHLPAALERIDMRVTGKVLNLPQLNPNYQQFQFLIENNPHGFQGRKILLNYYGPETIEPAQHWQFTVRLNQPHGFANPQTFDYEAWLLQKGITAKGYVRSSDSNLLLPGDRFSLELWRYRIKQTLLEAIAELEYKEIILALVLGDSSQIARSDRDVFTASGTSHLFVISGLHIGFAAAVGYWLSNYLARLFPLLLLLIPAQRVAALCAIVV
ncbi:MAG: ComEC/Rec2 family competence protein, partial [Gammaproteobacteria bacterium]|nr:ComEC/Rec2 family competence protein [Gammaproteobacteria bacterium]